MGTTGEDLRTWSSPLPSSAESKMGGATCIRPRSTISLHGVALNHSHELYFHFGSFSKTPTSVGKCRFKLHYLDLEMCVRTFGAEVFLKIPWKKEFMVQKWFQYIFRERGDTHCPDSISSIPRPYFLWNTQQCDLKSHQTWVNRPNLLKTVGPLETRANHLHRIKLTRSILRGL